MLRAAFAIAVTVSLAIFIFGGGGGAGGGGGGLLRESVSISESRFNRTKSMVGNDSRFSRMCLPVWMTNP